MKIDEILRISSQDFPEENVKRILQLSHSPIGKIDGLDVHLVVSGDERILILADGAEVASFAGFISRINDRVWQAKNLQTFYKYRGKKFGVKLYKFVKDVLKKSIQSDVEQTSSAEILWTKTLPKFGLHPKIFDTMTNYIIDKSMPKEYSLAIEKMYHSDDDSEDKYRYSWILEKNDYYNENSVLTEHKLLMPYTGKWHTFKN